MIKNLCSGLRVALKKMFITILNLWLKFPEKYGIRISLWYCVLNIYKVFHYIWCSGFKTELMTYRSETLYSSELVAWNKRVRMWKSILLLLLLGSILFSRLLANNKKTEMEITPTISIKYFFYIYNGVYLATLPPF